VLHITIKAAGRSCIYSLQHPSSPSRKTCCLLVYTRKDYVYLSKLNVSEDNFKTLFFFFFTAVFPSLSGYFSSRLLRTVIASQRHLFYPHFIFPMATENTIKNAVQSTVIVTILVCPKTFIKQQL